MEPHGTLWNLAEPCGTRQKLLEYFLIQIKVESPVYISSSQVPYRHTTYISINFAHFLTVCLLSQPASVQPQSPVTNNRRHCLTAVYTPYYYQSLYGLSIVATFRRLSLHGQPLALSTKACCDHPWCEPFLIQMLLCHRQCDLSIHLNKLIIHISHSLNRGYPARYIYHYTVTQKSVRMFS